MEKKQKMNTPPDYKPAVMCFNCYYCVGNECCKHKCQIDWEYICSDYKEQK